VFNVAELARLTGQDYRTVSNQMKRGWCAWPKRTLDGISKDIAYRCWDGMVQRCTNPKAKGFEWYGGRGISLHSEWRVSFRSFMDHIGPRPSKYHSIDRIDNSKGYEPGNVRWATSMEQAANRRCKRQGGSGISQQGKKFRFVYQGKRQSFPTWEEAAAAKDKIYGEGSW